MENRYGGNVRGLAEFSRSLPRVSITLGFFSQSGPLDHHSALLCEGHTWSFTVTKAYVGLHWGWDIALHLAKSPFPQQCTDKEGGRSYLREN